MPACPENEMAIYTELTEEDFARIAARFGLGPVLGTTPVPQGSINTNHLVETEHGRVFLRHTTVRSTEDLRFEAALLAHLAESHFPAPRLLPTLEGEAFLPFAKGHVSLFAYLVGEERPRSALTDDDFETLGATLGKLHRATNAFSGQRANPYGVEQVRGWLDGLSQHAEAEIASLGQELSKRLTRADQARSTLLPHGVIHADLFVDNVKWLGNQISAVFDFEMACVAPYMLDLAITLNAWCFDGAYSQEHGRALLRGYTRHRPLTELEREHLWAEALFGAVRFTASRIRDFHLSPLPAEKLVKKDFRTYLERSRALEQMGPKRFAAMLG
jgi:homoserine kinase type II